jgi:hypothetical protein
MVEMGSHSLFYQAIQPPSMIENKARMSFPPLLFAIAMEMLAFFFFFAIRQGKNHKINKNEINCPYLLMT